MESNHCLVVRVHLQVEKITTQPHPLSAGVVLVFGQKVFRIVKITGEGEGINLQCVSDVVELADWILDAILLRWEAEDSYAVAVMTAHNVLISYVVRDGKPVVDQYPSEVSCILYPECSPIDVLCSEIHQSTVLTRY